MIGLDEYVKIQKLVQRFKKHSQIQLLICFILNNNFVSKCIKGSVHIGQGKENSWPWQADSIEKVLVFYVS